MNREELKDEVSRLVYSELEGTGVPMLVKECIIDESLALFRECMVTELRLIKIR